MQMLPATKEWVCYEVLQSDEPLKFHELKTHGKTTLQIPCEEMSMYRDVRVFQHHLKANLLPASGSGNVFIDLKPGPTSTFYRSSAHKGGLAQEPMLFNNPDVNRRTYSTKTSTTDCTSTTQPCTAGNQCSDAWETVSPCGFWTMDVTPERNDVTLEHVMGNVTSIRISFLVTYRRELREVNTKHELKPQIFRSLRPSVPMCTGEIPSLCHTPNPCATAPCENGGVCLARPDGSYTCICDKSRFGGLRCEQALDGCAQKLSCGENQICVDAAFSGSYCKCRDGFQKENSSCVVLDTTAESSSQGAQDTSV